jgi:hypothetical protein
VSAPGVVEGYRTMSPSKAVQKLFSRQPCLLDDGRDRAARQVATMMGDRRMAARPLVEHLVMTAADPEDDETATLQSRHDLPWL